MTYNFKRLPVPIVGSTKFGRYPKISSEQTWNMIMSDDWLVPFAGYKNASTIRDTGKGRDIYYSSKGNFIIAVIDRDVYLIDSQLNSSYLASLNTYTGDISIAENEANQIAICDQLNLYIYNWVTGVFQTAVTGFRPRFVCFHDTYFICPEANTNRWYLSKQNDGLNWNWGSLGSAVWSYLQTEADNIQAVIPFPGHSNLIYVMGEVVTELWTDVGLQLFPYQKNTGLNIDYGCLNPSSIASGDQFIIWVAYNKKSGPCIVYSSGGQIEQISNDGINFKLAQLEHPEQCYSSLCKQDGHLIYLLTFYRDNFSLIYDFNTKAFFNVSDHKLNFHPAKKIIFFNNTYYFISINDAKLYELNSFYTDQDGIEMQHIRITPNVRLPDSSPFIADEFVITMEQGEMDTAQRVDLSISKNGGASFSGNVSKDLQPIGDRKNIVRWWQLGQANDLVFQLRFQGQGRFVVGNGEVNIYQ